jgi:nitroimidazol reductase NimA-like FMN-containing flavoprotein (pyridoxamine 5'-phosphate oxidase superfamily)
MVELTRSECLTLLAATRVGRLVVTIGATPVIRPVNYIFDGPSQSVVFRSAPGSKLYALARSARAAFEIDAIDEVTSSGWSVIIIGVTHEVTHPIEVQRLSRLGLRTWAPGSNPHWIRIRARTVSGRRIVSRAQ